MRTVVTFMMLFGFIGILFGYGGGESLKSCATGLGVGMIFGLIVGGIVWDENRKK
jgi:hypothetical protein